MGSSRAIERCFFTAIYIAVVLLVIYGAHQITNLVLDINFIHHYLDPWEVQVVALRSQGGVLPQFTEHNPADYMRALVSMMRAHGVQPPDSNTQVEFVYRLNRFGEKTRSILLVYVDGRMILYGLPASTFDRLDRHIDGLADPLNGRFTGEWSADRITRIGSWRF